MNRLHRRHILTLSGALAVLPAAALFAAAPALAGDKKPEYVNTGVLYKQPDIGDRMLGKADAPVTIVEYASATCPHCAEFHEKTWPVIKKKYVDTGKVRFIFREFPLDQLALAAFMLMRCAPKDKYHPMLGLIMKTQRTWVKNPKEELLKIAKLAGMTEADFNACIKNQKLANSIVGISKDASRDFGVNSTPTFFINGRRAVGDMGPDEFGKIIDEELKKARKSKG